MDIRIKRIGRECDGCNMCCIWTTGSAYGYEFGSGKPCHFLRQGCCTIYPNHPVDPCKTFECQWKSNKNLPEWLKPDKSHVIILKRFIEIFDYMMIVPAGKPINEEVLTWADTYSKEHIRNHIVAYVEPKYLIYSQHKSFIELADKKWNQGG